MAVVSFKKLQEVAKKSKETFILDLGKYVDAKLEGACIPIKVKSFEESIRFKTDFKLKNEKLTISYVPFGRAPKAFRDWYSKEMQSRGKDVPTYVQLCDASRDAVKLETMKYRERLFNILIHLDMDYLVEEKTMWEDMGLKKDDYDGLVNTFSDIITFENHLDILDILIDELKNGNTDEQKLVARVHQYGLQKYINSIENAEDRKEFIDNFTKMIENHSENLAKEEGQAPVEV